MENYATNCKSQDVCSKLGHDYPECTHGNVATGRCPAEKQVQITLLGAIAEKLGVNLLDLKK